MSKTSTVPNASRADAEREGLSRVHDPAFFHRLYGTKRPRAVYHKRDFPDYVLMLLASASVVVLCYGPRSFLSLIGVALCASMLCDFVIRHGVEFRTPLLLKNPLELLYVCAYKLRNLKPIYFFGLAVLLLENVAIHLTPGLPHHTSLMRTIGLYLFFIHLAGISIFRTVILIDHLAKRDVVRQALMETPWKRVINEKTNITLECLHAYGTGLLTHIILIAPWYLVITYSQFSVLLLPFTCAANVFTYLRWLRVFNTWFYRDHWLGHNSELEFIFLHGTHHDAIPSGMIAVAENGFLEGFLRFTMGSPTAMFNPVISFLIFSSEIKDDIQNHQYIPGMFPKLPRKVMEVFQHSTHHYGPLEPYGIGSNLEWPTASPEFKAAFDWIPDEIRNSYRLDEELTGFQWDNPTYRRTLKLWDKYKQ